MIEGATRGDPESPLLWTSRSVARLTTELRALGHQVHESTVRRQLRALGFSLQANRKTREGSDHPDRDGQFEHIAAVSTAVIAAREPLISVDTKKKELIGNYKNGGRELTATGAPILVNTHDFIDHELGKAIPYGIYDVGRDEGWVSVGITTLRSSRSRRSRPGGSTSALALPERHELDHHSRLRRLKQLPHPALEDRAPTLADQLDLPIRVLHYPPGTSKWNKIEHRLFSYISINWRAKPLISRQVVIDLIAATTTSTGLKVYARLDTNTYPTKIQITDEQIQAVNSPGRLPSRVELHHRPDSNKDLTLTTACTTASPGIGLYLAGVGGGLLALGGVYLHAAAPTPSSGAQTRVEVASAREMKRCPDCAEDVMAEARICKHCGFRFA